MNFNNQEQEVKFFLARREVFERRLLQSGAVLHNPRTFERNLRFDTPDGSLTQTGQVLRLRRDERLRLTYKSPAAAGQIISSRQEIEFEVSSFENAQALLEALGYIVSIAYEKYRTTYQLGEVEVVVDELPFGDFAEIEGPSPESIHTAANAIGLNWEARCVDSYLALFTRLRTRSNITANNLTFEEIAEKYPAKIFGLRPGDGSAS